MTRLTHDELAAVAARLKIPVKHVVEYHRFMHGHSTTKLDKETKKYINEKVSRPKFMALDKAVGRKPKSIVRD